MNRETFSKLDVRFTIAVAALIAVCLIYIRLEYDRAFPQASIQLRLSKAEITARAARWLEGRGLKTAGFRQITTFDPDDDARLYLERELGLERANGLMQSEVAVWRWRARWFHPPQQEELLVWMSPAEGRVTGFQSVIPESAAGARLSHEDALRIAQDFLHGLSSAPMHVVEDRLEQKPNRWDYLFTWEQDGFRAKDATYRRTIVMHGDAVGRYAEFLYVPEDWRRDFAAMRSKNELYASIAEAFWLPLVVAALVLLVRGLRRHEIPWRPLVALAGSVGALMTASQLNSIPLLVDRFPTSSPYLQTLLLIVLMSLGAGVGVFFYVIVAGTAGEPLYRRRTGDPLSLASAFTPGGAGSRRFYRAVLAGYGFAAVHIAFLVAFYLIGRRLGVWSPQDVQYSDLLSTALPAIYPVAIASMAASSEEFWFRLLAIPLLLRLARNRWIAVIVPAFIWGFLHANYPQQPAWIRGVEVGLIGVAAGLVMLRFGIVSTLVWHYTVDALLIGSSLFGASSWFFQLQAGVLLTAVLAPLLVSLVLYRRNRGFTAIEETGAQELEPAPRAEDVQELVPALQPAMNVHRLYAAAALAGVLGVVAAPHIYGDWIRIRVDRPGAEGIGRGTVPDANRRRASTDFVSNLDPAEFEYLRRLVGPDGADRIVRERKPTAVWRTRWFRPLEKEEWRTYVDQSGSVIRKDHILDERAPGDRLTAEAARQLAEGTLPVKSLKLVDASEERRENRTDWSFVFEDPTFHAGDARSRTSIELHGSEPSNLRRFLKLPEEWLREFQTPRMRNFAVPAVLGSMAMPLLIIFVRRLGAPDTRFHWWAYGLGGTGALLCALLSTVNQWATVMSGYDTATPEQNYITQYLIGRGVIVVLTALGIFALLLALDVFRQTAVGRAVLNAPSFPRTVAIAVLIAGLSRVTGWVLDRVPGPRPSVPVWSATGLDTYAPGLAAITQGYLTSMLALCCLGTLVFAGLSHMSLRRRRIANAILLGAIAYSQALTPWQFIAHALTAAVWMGALWLIVRTCAADLTGFGVAVFWVVSLASAAELMQQPAPALRWNGIAAALVAVLLGVIAIARARSAAKPAPLWR